MRIDSVRLVNYRCFSDGTVQFSPWFNVLAGTNGSGKTSVLNGVCEALAALPNSIAGAEPLSPLKDENDVRLEIVERKGRVRFERRFPVEIRTTGEMLSQKLHWSVIKKTPLAPIETEGTPPGNIIAKADRRLPDTSADITLPFVAFYRSGRSWKQALPDEIAAVATRSSRADAFKTWWDASADASGLQSWVIAKTLERAQESAESGKSFAAVDGDELAQVNDALACGLEGSKGLYYDMRQKMLALEWVSTGNARSATPFVNLSDGQRVIVGLVTDIARRMCLLNPHLGSTVTRATPGVVLIDELDVHLHPQWQRLITHGLRRAFPSIQFITASHSPQILSELEPDQIIMLHAEGIGHPSASYGLDSSRVLEEIMGAVARPLEIADLLGRIFESIERGDLESARKDTAILARRSPDLPELQRIAALLARKEALHR